MSSHYRPASETPFKWRFAGGPMMARLQWYLDPSSPHQPKNQKQKNKTINVKVGPPLTKLSGSAHVNSVDPDHLIRIYTLSASLDP